LITFAGIIDASLTDQRQLQQARSYRTRSDNFAGVWRELEELLEREPGLEALTLMEHWLCQLDLAHFDGLIWPPWLLPCWCRPERRPEGGAEAGTSASLRANKSIFVWGFHVFAVIYIQP
jgi:hypothetical protein